MELLGFEERIRLAVRTGESHFREFKSAIDGPSGAKKPRAIRDVSRNIATTLVAFANSDGGELLVGVEDDGEITGVPHSPDEVRDLLRAPVSHVHADTPLPSPRSATVEVDGKTIVYFSVPKGTEYVYLTSDARCVKRQDIDSIPASSEVIRLHRVESESRRWEREFERSASISDLDIDLLTAVSGQIAYGVSIEKCLQYLDLAEFALEGLVLKRAAMVLFAKDIRRWHPGCHVRILTVDGREKGTGADYNIVKDDVAADNIMTLVESAWERLMVALVTRTRMTDEVKFERTFLYPEAACREALVNAIVHRNYAVTGRGIEIEIYNDRMEIRSPGMLLSTISLNDLRESSGVHESRNPLIARVLREVGYVREMGEGVRRIYNVMRSNALAAPIIDSKSDGFSVTLFHRSMYEPAVRLWLSQFDSYNPTENQRAVLALGHDNQLFSSQNIIDALGLVDTDHVREILTPLRSAGLVVRARSHGVCYNLSQKLRIPKREVKAFQVQVPQDDREKMNETTELDASSEAPDKATQKVEVLLENLDPSWSRNDVVELLRSECEVVSIHMPGSEAEGPNRGHAYAVLTSEIAPYQLVLHLNGRKLGGRKLSVKRQRGIGNT